MRPACGTLGRLLPVGVVIIIKVIEFLVLGIHQDQNILIFLDIVNVLVVKPILDQYFFLKKARLQRLLQVIDFLGQLMRPRNNFRILSGVFCQGNQV